MYNTLGNNLLIPGNDTLQVWGIYSVTLFWIKKGGFFLMGLLNFGHM